MEQKCCTPNKNNVKKGILPGILYGLLPHSFCLAFGIFSIFGAITATTILKNVLLIPNLFYYLILISLLLATISVYIYLRKTKCLGRSGIKSNWKYISTIYSLTMMINLVFFYGVIPVLANAGNKNYELNEKKILSEINIKVGIPCTGHSFLIIDEISKNVDINDIRFKAPDIFNIKFDAQNISPEQILNIDIFKDYKATVI